jgi:hypothetical protein
MGWPNGLPIPYMLAWQTTFYEAGSDQALFSENGLLELSKGSGVLLPNGLRYRVVDSWLSFDKDGHFGLGTHIFLERIEERGEDDTLYKLAPDYFG